MELVNLRLNPVRPLVRRQLAAEKRRRRGFFYGALLTADISALFIGFALAGAARFGDPFHSQAMTLLAAILPLFLITNSRGFVPEVLDNWRPGGWRAIFSLLLAAVIVMSVGFFLKASTELSRLVASGALAVSAGLMVSARMALGWVTVRAFSGSSKSKLLILDDVQMAPPPGVDVLHADGLDLTSHVDHPLVLDRLSQHLRGVDDAFIACSPERRRGWAMVMKGSAVRTELLVPELDGFGAIGNEHFAGVATVLVSAGTFRLRDQVMKRALDLAIAVPAVIFLAPLLIIIAIVIRIDTPGPALFVQKRVGIGNRLFQMFKFRSMRAETTDQDGRTSTGRGDVRVTRVGKFIRATSIDELPQLLNILRGDMSFVGPRPHAIGSLAGDQLFWEVDHRYNHRHACKPGLTGLAQVRGFRGATHKREDLVNRLDADLEYINGWSVQRDLSILFATLRVVVHGNAY